MSDRFESWTRTHWDDIDSITRSHLIYMCSTARTPIDIRMISKYAHKYAEPQLSA